MHSCQTESSTIGWTQPEIVPLCLCAPWFLYLTCLQDSPQNTFLLNSRCTLSAPSPHHISVWTSLNPCFSFNSYTNCLLHLLVHSLRPSTSELGYPCSRVPQLPRPSLSVWSSFFDPRTVTHADTLVGTSPPTRTLNCLSSFRFHRCL